MKLEVARNHFDSFTKDETCFCVDKQFNIYEVWESEKSWMVVNCIGKMKVIMDGSKIKQWIYPMHSARDPYTLIHLSQINWWKKTIEIYEKRKPNQ